MSNRWNKASILLNVILGVTILVLVARPRVQQSEPSSVVANNEPVNPSPHPTTSRPDIRNETSVVTLSVANGASWIESLRAAGIPNKVLARVVLADFEDRWQKRLGEVQHKYDLGEVDMDAFANLAQERETEQEKELRIALGEEGFKQWDMEQTLQGLNLKNVNLTVAETNSLYELQKELQRRFRDLEAARQRGEIDEAEFGEKQSAAQQNHEERMKALLGDARYAALQGVGEVDGELRRSLRKVNASDTQFESLVAMQKDWAEKRAEIERQMQNQPEPSAAIEEKLQALDAARDLEYQRVLGTNTFDALQKEQDYRYTTMKRYASLWNIDEAQMDYIFRTIRYYEKTVQDYDRAARALEQRGEAVDWDAVQKNLRQFSQQIEQALQGHIGNERYGKLKKNNLTPFGE